MKRRLYLIAALAVINVGIMKYHEYKSDQKNDTWAMMSEGQVEHTDSLMIHTNK